MPAESTHARATRGDGVHHVGPYKIPFPYAPYQLQEHAMTALRSYLESQRRDGDGDGGATRRATSTATHTAAAAAAAAADVSASRRSSGSDSARPPARVAVLESPTGTGKSLMLLSSVLSHLFDVEDAEMDVKVDAVQHSPEAPPVVQPEGSAADATTTAAAPAAAVSSSSSPPTLEDVLRQQRLGDIANQLRSERRARVRAQRRQLRHARALMRQSRQSETCSDSGGGEVDHLLTQDPVAWCAEHSPAMVGGGGEHSAQYRPGLLYSESSSDSSSADEDADGDDDGDDDAEGRVEAALATLVPLRSPKVFFASRTHTQLQQLMGDLQRTAFAKHRLHPRPSVTETPPPLTSPPPPHTPPPRRLAAVHVAGRQHLCLNTALLRRAGGSGDRLSHYCREAIQYERSKAGRQHRRQREQQQQQPLTSDRRPAVADIESAPGESKGCVFCVDSHLRALLTHLLDEQQRADATATATDAGGTPSPSILTMERLRELGTELRACPYIATRLLLRGADVAFIPYGYVLDEGQRAAVLGGVTTNAATAAEAAMQPVTPAADDRVGSGGGGEDEDVSDVGPPSLGAVLYHRRQRVTATIAFRQRRERQHRLNGVHTTITTSARRGRGETGEAEEEEESAMWRAVARGAPPFLGDAIFIFDEAHNMADHCRAASTVVVAAWQLQLVRGLVETYLHRYAARLLTRNKQRLRELISFLQKLETFCTRAVDGDSDEAATAVVAAAAAAAAAATLGARDGDGECVSSPSVAMPVSRTARLVTARARVLPLHTFLFDAGVDNVDVFAFLTFLVDSQLAMKVHGFVAHTLEAEAQAAVTHRTDVHVSRTVRAKRSRGTDGDDGGEQADYATHRHRRTLPSLAEHLSSGTTTTADAAAAAAASSQPRPSLTQLLSERLHPRTTSTTTATASLALARDPVQMRAVAADALQCVEQLLRVLYLSDSASTRVLWTPPSTSAAPQHASLKIVQLEPGRLTFAPLLKEARAVVLAGGTMQPLALTCGPLLPPLSRRGAGEVDGAGVPLPVELIAEGHVVPSSSVQVWVLGAGPSGLRVELSQQALGLRGDGATAAAVGTHAHRVLAEVGSVLLNVARVLPPAGVICFFTSYDVMETFVAVLHGTGYYAQLDEVKRIFCETRSSSSSHSNTGGGDGATADVLRDYQEWISGAGRGDAPEAQPLQHHPPRRGALLFAVMGGRLSEGINFADDLGRAVIVLGMPYANPTDVELQMMLRHIAATRLRGEVAPATADAAASSFTSAEEWGLYMDGMMRTVNQCVGRCIRHAGDYAAILLLDARYAERPDVRRRVSAWLQPSVRVAQSFGVCFRGLREFFEARQKAPPHNGND